MGLNPADGCCKAPAIPLISNGPPRGGPCCCCCCCCCPAPICACCRGCWDWDDDEASPAGWLDTTVEWVWNALPEGRNSAEAPESCGVSPIGTLDPCCLGGRFQSWSVTLEACLVRGQFQFVSTMLDLPNPRLSLGGDEFDSDRGKVNGRRRSRRYPKRRKGLVGVRGALGNARRRHQRREVKL